MIEFMNSQKNTDRRKLMATEKNNKKKRNVFLNFIRAICKGIYFIMEKIVKAFACLKGKITASKWYQKLYRAFIEPAGKHLHAFFIWFYKTSYLLFVFCLRAMRRSQRRLGRFFRRNSAVLYGVIYKYITKPCIVTLHFLRDLVYNFVDPFSDAAKVTADSYEIIKLEKKKKNKHIRSVFKKEIGICLKSYYKLLLNLVNHVAPVAAALALIFVIGRASNLTFALQVVYAGQDIGYVSDETVYNEAAKMMNGRIVYDNNEEKKVAQSNFSLAVVAKDQLADANEFCNKMIATSGDVIQQATGFYVDGVFQGATVNGESLKNTLQSILAQYDDGVSKVEFNKAVELKEGLYPVESIAEEGKLESLASSTVEGERSYVAQAGDAPLSIAAANNMSLDDLVQLNPGITESLKVGDKVLLATSKPFLPVQTTKHITYTESISYSTEKISDKRYTSSYQKVTQPGEKGEREVQALVTMVDGIEVAREVTATTVLKEPVTEKIVVGTKTETASSVYVGGSSSGDAVNAPAFNGTFAWPVAGGYVSCGYWGYRGHTGMDIASGSGTPIMASASGTVIASGWDSTGYGYRVIIDHGNGYKTLYAHCSKLAVSAGQKVGQGQVIAYVGRTGRASGNHCHFEIRYNNQALNPAKFL